ncbi:MAG: hypothetical protein PVI66_11635 [Candidatus Aminicenantes bacterium]|jgi:hypothetical protein
MNQPQTQSSNTTKKWLIGCGIGCGVILLIVVILITSGYFFIKNIVDEFKDTEAVTEALTERFGRIPDFCPDPEGTIRTERIEAFLSARDAFAPARERVSRSMEALSRKKDMDDIEVGKPKSVFTMVRLGFGIIPQTAEFIKTRNEALLEAGMGLGEYYYIYAVAFYSWLGKNPEDGPGFQIVGPDEDEDFVTWEREDSKELQRERMRRRLNRMLLPMLHNQLEKLKTEGETGSRGGWLQILEREIDALEEDRERILWQEGLPEVIEASLQPYRGQLEASYNPLTNPLEMMIQQR